MDRDAVYARLTDIFRDVFQNDEVEIEDATTAADVAGWDSLSNILMVLAVEKGFKIRLTASRVAGLKDVGSFVTVIEAMVNRR